MMKPQMIKKLNSSSKSADILRRRYIQTQKYVIKQNIMRIRNFLLIHSSRSIRAMIKKFILADLDDVEIVESQNGQLALRLLAGYSFDLIICNCDLEDMPITTLRREILEYSPRNKTTDIIALLEEDDARAALVKASFPHIVRMPFQPLEFISKINQVCNPRKWRKSDRFHIPDSMVTIHVWEMQAEAQMINISRGGVLVEISGDRSDLLLQNNPKLTLDINPPGCSYKINNLPAKLTRINVVAWNENYKPALMRLAYIFLDLDQDATSDLEQALEFAKTDGVYIAEGQEN